MRLINNDIDKIIIKILDKKHPLLAPILLNWHKIVGEEIGKKAQPVKITTSLNQGKKYNILYLEIASSSASVEIAFKEEIILERIAVYLGFKAIDRIKLMING